ncbi:MAG TPA: CaiB/BaiF CoA-transferase family protein [Dehalococcoidia bacterium]|nr:CaiB/BaiF CoA-transferase family protein [Dehalococcoidia bacterium]
MVMPLEGIKIVDLSRLAPGPYGTMILGDLGAEIVKVEEAGPPGGRRVEQQGAAKPAPERSDRERVFNALDRNKRSIRLNLKDEAGLEIFYQLVRDADVVMEEFRPDVKKRLKIDYETLSAMNPRIIYCSLTGYGQDGPYRDLVGHDINYISIGGALGAIGWPGTPPAIPLNLLADFAGGGMHAAIGILAAIVAREKTGRGQQVDIAMTDGVVSLMTSALSAYFANGVVPRPGEYRNNGKNPHYNVYQTRDGKWLSLGSNEPWFYANLCRAIGREDLIPFQQDESRAPEIRTAIATAIAGKDRDEWFEILSQTDICVGKVYSLDEVPNDPHLRARRMIIELDHPEFGKVPQAGIPMKLSDTPGEARFPAPLAGQHTDEILGELGYTRDQVEQLRAAGSVR